MFNAIPATTSLGISNPMAQQTALVTTPQAIRTNNSEQLEAKNVRSLKESANAKRLRRRHEDERDSNSQDEGDSHPPPRKSVLETIMEERQTRARTTKAATSAILNAQPAQKQGVKGYENRTVPPRLKSVDIMA